MVPAVTDGPRVLRPGTNVADVEVVNRLGQRRRISELLTLEEILWLVIDPGRLEAAAEVIRLFDRLAEAADDVDVRVGFLVVGVDAPKAVEIAGSWAARHAVYADPDGALVRAAGVTATPALVWIDGRGDVRVVVEGWDAATWEELSREIATAHRWVHPTFGFPDDPPPLAPEPLTV